MAEPLYATSDAEEIELQTEPASDGTLILRRKESYVTVANSVLRGIKVRDSKPHRRKECYPAIIDLPKQNNVRKRKTRKFVSNSCPGCSHWRTIPLPSRSLTAMNTSTKKTRLRCRIKCEKKTMCPMRIAELAVPSKRHCIDTWRNKSYILPAPMLERLKRQVLDQQPVVQISDAVYFFRKRKTGKNRKKCFANPLKYWEKQMEEPLCKQNSRTLCIVFAQKIIQRLLIPLNISIGPEYENLSRIVASDIVRLIKGRKYVTAEYIEKYRKVHAQDVNKITVWIIGILEDLAFKQLEEQLRELEEEEGPVLDFLDDLLEQVFNICFPKAEEAESELEGEGESEVEDEGDGADEGEWEGGSKKLTNSMIGDHIDEELITDYFKNEISKLVNVLLTEDNVKFTDNEYFENEINNLLNVVFKESDDKIGDLINDTEQTTEENIENAQLEDGMIQTIDNIAQNANIVSDVEYSSEENIQNAESVNYTLETTEDIIEKAQLTSDVMVILEENIEDVQLAQMHISEGDDIIIGDENIDTISEDTTDRSKKVMFSVSDIVIPPNAQFSSNFPHIAEAGKESQSFYNYVRPIHQYAEPNENLLSNADELWPNHTLTPALLRPSASVTKSISSLGILSENDEGETSVFPNKIIKVNEDNEHPILSIDTEIQLHVASPDTFTESEDMAEKVYTSPEVETDTKVKTVEDDASMKNEKDGTLSIIIDINEEEHFTTNNTTSKSINIGVQTQINYRDNESQTVGKTTNVNLEISKNIITNIDEEILKDKLDSENVDNPSKKQTLETNINKEKKERIIDRFKNNLCYESQPTKSMPGLNICKWCRDLDTGFINLEIWQDWIQDVCMETTDFLNKKKHCTVTNNNCMGKHWKVLKNNIDNDAAVLGNLHRKTKKTFEYYRKYYKTEGEKCMSQWVSMKQPNYKTPCGCITVPRNAQK